MKNSAEHTMGQVVALAALAGIGLLGAAGTAWFDGLVRLPACLLAVLPLAAIFAAACRRVRDEDHVARLEAALCCERNARTQADQALAEADLLLARLATRARRHGADPATQMRAIHAELTQVQRQLVRDQPQLAMRIDALCHRLERVAAGLRTGPRAAEPG